jgi:parallel beta-helix repeat protein
LILGGIETPPERVRDLKVENLTLDGNRDLQDMECWLGPCDSGGVTYIRNNAITIRGVHGAKIKNVRALRARSGGMVTERDCAKLHVDGLVAKDNYFDGFAGYKTTDSLFENLDLSENLGAGVSLDIHFHGNTFKNSKLNKNMDVGIFMRDSNDNTFYGLTLQDSGSHGVFCAQVEDQVSTGPKNNIFENLIIAGARGNGFHLNNASCTGNQLINPTFSNIRGQNIFEGAPGTLKFMFARRCEEFFKLAAPPTVDFTDRLKAHRESARRSLLRGDEL